jgi:hypothetical protein
MVTIALDPKGYFKRAHTYTGTKEHKMAKHFKADNPERYNMNEAEIETMGMYNLILSGMNKRDAVRAAKKTSWGKRVPNSRLMNRYISAREWFREDLFSYREYALEDIFSKYWSIYRTARERDNTGGDWVMLSVLKELRGLLKLDEAAEEQDLSRKDLIAQITSLMDTTAPVPRPKEGS